MTILRQLARARRFAASGSSDAEDKLAIGSTDLDHVADLYVSAQQFLGKRIFEITLDRAAHWSGAILWIVPFLDQKFFRGLIQLNMNIFRFDPTQHFSDFEFDDLHQVALGQLMEDNDVVEPIDELRLEHLLRFLEQPISHRLEFVLTQRFRGGESHRRLTPQNFGADI